MITKHPKRDVKFQASIFVRILSIEIPIEIQFRKFKKNLKTFLFFRRCYSINLQIGSKNFNLEPLSN